MGRQRRPAASSPAPRRAAPPPALQQPPAGAAPLDRAAADAAAGAKAEKSRAITESNLSRLDYKINQVGFLVQPYKGAPPPLGAGFLFSKDGRKRAWERIQNFLSMGVAVATLMRSVPGFSSKGMKEMAAEMYTAVNRGLALGQLDALQDMVVPSEFKRMAHDRERWRKQRWDRIEWRLEGELRLKDISVVHGRLLKMHKDAQVAFVQITLKIPSRQRFAAYTRKGAAAAAASAHAGGAGGGGGRQRWAVVAGDPDEVIDVVDYWVVERKLFDFNRATKQKLDPPGARWRLAARLQLDGGADGGAGAGGGGGGAGA
ncbi:MAG: hypothetical protein J3K34DRAFT_509794 [Monoraphidium minutum]|nr:MAG: hypothetical protein J3K34DRAFT_509794 [Monoraphidium minutum]